MSPYEKNILERDIQQQQASNQNQETLVQINFDYLTQKGAKFKS